MVFTAPELVDRMIEPTPSTDMWSCGAILYLLLSGKLPFNASNSADLLDLIKKGDWDFSGDLVGIGNK